MINKMKLRQKQKKVFKVKIENKFKSIIASDKNQDYFIKIQHFKGKKQVKNNHSNLHIGTRPINNKNAQNKQKKLSLQKYAESFSQNMTDYC